MRSRRSRSLTADLCLLAGADETAIPQRIEEGRCCRAAADVRRSQPAEATGRIAAPDHDKVVTN